MKRIPNLYFRSICFTAEEHTIFGGVGGAVAECVAGRFPVPVKRVGIADTFAESGPYLDLLDKYGMSVRATAEAVRRALKLKSSTAVRENRLERTQDAKICS